MFTTFTCNEPAKNRKHNSPPKIPSYFSTAQFSRTACDICRARNLKCRGTGESCDACIASSTTCTYTFSSGIGPGKKKRRKVCSPNLNASISQQRQISPPGRSSHEYEGPLQTQNARSKQRSSEWGRLQDTPYVAVVAPDELTRDDTNIVNSHSAPCASDTDWSDVQFSGDAFVLCPGKHMSAGTHPAPQLQSLLHSLPDPESALHNNVTSPLDPELFQMFEMSSPQMRSEPSPQMRGDPPTSRTPRRSSFSQKISQNGAFDFTPPFTSRPFSSNSTTFRQDTTGMAEITAFGKPSSFSSRCDCLASIRQSLDELGLQRSSDIEVALTDTLFLSVEKSIDQLSTMLSCNKCDVNDVSPMLVVTHVNQLALMLSEIVYRLTHCQSPESVPTIFQFGRYSVQKSKMRTSLLTGMIGLHVRSLNELITRLERYLADQPRLLLAGATNMVTKMRQTLEAFPDGSSPG